MNNDYFPLKLAVAILGILALMTLSCTISLGQPAPTPMPAVPAYDWLLNAEPFPERWQADPCDPDCERAERPHNALRTFGIVNVPGHVIQQVFYFGSERSARAKFQRYEETTSFSTPEEISYRSPIADEQYLRCGVDKVPACWAGLRYENYFVYFYFDIDGGRGDGLKIEEIEPILRAIDVRAGELLGIPLPDP